MSDRVAQSFHGSDGMAGQSMHPNQSSWMAHWMRTSCKSEPQAYNCLSLHCESREDDHGILRHPLLSEPGVVSDISESTKGVRGVNEARTVKLMNDSMATSSSNLRNKRLDSQPFPMFNLCRNNESIFVPKKDQPTICHRKVQRSQLDHNSGYNTIALGTSESHRPSVLALAPPETETSSRTFHFQPKCISQNPELPVKSHKFLEKNSLAASKSFLDDFMGSSSSIVPFNSKKIPIQSFMCRQEKVDQLNSVLVSKEPFTNTTLTHFENEHCNYHSYSAFLVCEEKTDNHVKSGTCGTSLLRQSDGTLLLHDPSTSNNQLQDLLGEQGRKMQNHSGLGFFPSRSSLADVTKSEKLYHEYYSLQKVPCPAAHDVETMRLCTTVDSVEGISRCPPKCSQTTHRLVITEKNDVNLSERAQRFRESSTKFKGNKFSGLLSLSPPCGFHNQSGLKLQPLYSSTDSEGKENTRHTKTSAVDLKNESSAETDTMDMDAFQEKNHFSDLALSLSNKDIIGGQNLTSSQAKIASAREEFGGRLPNTELPDINEEPSSLPAVGSSTGDGEPSTSRTQSLNAEHLLSHAEQPMNSKSSPCADELLGPDPSSRWVKRLKLRSDSFAHGTKSSKMGEASSHEKVSKFFSKIMKCSITSSEPTLGIRHGKEHMALDQTSVLLRKGESSSMDPVKKGTDIALSRSWIQRWCHNRAASPRKKPEAVVVCEPQTSKGAFNNLKEKQFPSVAAMALMGRAMSRYQPCEFRKRGSFVVWNTRGF